MTTFRIGEIEVSEENFAQWKHHPVTKVFLQYLRDYERYLAQLQVAELRASSTAMDPFRQGEFKGRISAVAEMAGLTLSHIVQFYQTDESEEEQEEPSEDQHAA